MKYKILQVGAKPREEIEITKDMLEGFVKHWEENIYGVPLCVNLGFDSSGISLGEVIEVRMTDDFLEVDVKWSDYYLDNQSKFEGLQLVPSFATRWYDDVIDKEYNNVLCNLALTPYPSKCLL